MGLEEILVIEEKNPTAEWLVKDALYGSANQPRVLGKTPRWPASNAQPWILDAELWCKACLIDSPCAFIG
ncbi:MAG: hypothetical protein CM15mP49_15600 [Actinomycetota bacterium]|nr:MAG: hypothetical protein CM15mP49_15600 [Actinomycetota bacterium]